MYCRLSYLFVASVGILSPSIAHAGGFYLQEQSQVEIGRAMSGAAAAADDPSILVFNPAAITELEGMQVSVGGTLVFIDQAQQDFGSTRSLGGGPAVPVGGGNGGNPFHSVVPIPSTYVTKQLGDRFWVGLAISAPFGLKLDYDDDFFGRYDSLHSSLKTYNVQPSLAFKLSERLSIGGGVDIQYADAKLTSALPNASPLQPDGMLTVEGDDLSFGWNAGIFYTDGRVSAGLHYRSSIKHELEGDYVITGLQAPLAGGNVDTPVTAPLKLPDIATFSLAYKATPKLKAMATARWYNWSNFEGLRLFPDAAPASFKEINYSDSWSVSIGGDYEVQPGLTVRTGFMYDKTPTDLQFQTTRLPDGNRHWLTVGATLALSEKMRINLSAAHVYIDGKAMDRTDLFYQGTPAATAVRTLNRVESNVDMIASSVVFSF